MNAKSRWWVTSVALASLAILQGTHPVRTLDLSMALFFCGFVAVADMVRFRWRSFDIDVGSVALIPVFLLRGPLPAAALCFIGILAGRLLSRQRLDMAAFAAARTSLGTVAGSFAYYAVSARLASGRPELVFEPVALSCFLIASVAVTHVLDGIERQVSSGVFSMGLLGEMVVAAARRDLFVRTLSVPLGYMVAWLYTTEGLWGAAVLAVPVAAFARIFSLHSELVRANGELMILFDMARQVGTVLQLDRLFGMIADAARKVVSHDICSLYLWNETAQELTRSLASPAQTAEAVPVRAGDGIVGAVITSREPELIADVSRDPRSGAREEHGSLLVVPLVVEDGLVGAIELRSSSTDPFVPDHLRMLTILSSQAAVAIANAILYNRTEQSSITDPLTGLFNYRHLHTRLTDELRRARACGGSLAVVYLDLDRFKDCNDTYGHLAGDYVLAEFAAIVREHVRDEDVPIRYAGDEFVLILPGVTVNEGRNVAERIRAAVSQHVFVPGVGIRVRMTVSAGVVGFPGFASTESELIRQADRAMYASKRHGSNRVSVAD